MTAPLIVYSRHPSQHWLLCIQHFIWRGVEATCYRNWRWTKRKIEHKRHASDSHIKQVDCDWQWRMTRNMQYYVGQYTWQRKSLNRYSMRWAIPWPPLLNHSKNRIRKKKENKVYRLKEDESWKGKNVFRSANGGGESHIHKKWKPLVDGTRRSELKNSFIRNRRPSRDYHSGGWRRRLRGNANKTKEKKEKKGQKAEEAHTFSTWWVLLFCGTGSEWNEMDERISGSSQQSGAIHALYSSKGLYEP